MNRSSLRDDELENVNGGRFRINGAGTSMYYHHADGSVSYHAVLDGGMAWSLICSLEAQNVHEDIIFARLVDHGYIRP